MKFYAFICMSLCVFSCSKKLQDLAGLYHIGDGESRIYFAGKTIDFKANNRFEYNTYSDMVSQREDTKKMYMLSAEYGMGTYTLKGNTLLLNFENIPQEFFEKEKVGKESYYEEGDILRFSLKRKNDKQILLKQEGQKDYIIYTQK